MRKATFFSQRSINYAAKAVLPFAFLALVIINLKTH